MLDWLRRKIGCVSTHEELIHSGITENNINRFKVLTDPSLTSENYLGVKSGILEVNDDELVYYQNNSEPIRWSYRCLRRYGMGNDTFLFESGRRCTTGPGLFAFKCRRADILHNIFTEKLKLFAANPNGNMDSLHRRQSDFPLNSPPTLNRYSEDVRLSSHSPAANIVVEEPYMTPIPTNQGLYFNVGVMTGLPGYGQPVAHENGYVNTHAPAPQTYVNAIPQISTHPIHPNPYCNGAVREVGSSSSNGSRLPAIREFNYAVLDLPRSDAIGFNQVPRKPKTQPMTSTFQYYNIGNSSSDDDDDAVFPTSTETARPPSVLRPPSVPTVDSSSATQYTTIDFQKTEAIANTTKSSQAESTQEGVRKTRHDSSADDLH